MRSCFIGKVVVVFFLFLALFIAINPVIGGNYGVVELTGVSVMSENYVFFAKSYTLSHNPDECISYGDYYPNETAYTFWISKVGNEEVYMHLFSAYMLGKKAFVDAIYNPIENYPCELQTENSGFRVGDYD